MRISILFILCLFCGLIITLPSFAEEAGVEGQSSTSASVEKQQQDGSGPLKNETQQFVIRVKTKQKVDFSGIVTHVDPETNIISLRSQGKTISFDMSKSILIGYRSIGEIKKGDEVSVGYTQYGLQIRKGIFAVTHREAAPQKAAVRVDIAKPHRVDIAKPQRGTPIRMTYKKNATSFNSIDNNKDGKVTPIELCVLVPDLTLQKFKEYDKNGDGCLNEREFNTVKRTKQ